MIAPNPNTRDGIAKYSYKLTEELKLDGEDILYVSTKRGGVKDPSLHLPVIGYSPLDFFKLLGVFYKVRPDIIHVQYAIPTFGLLLFPIWISVLSAKIFFRSKIVVTLHEVSREISLLGMLAKLYFYSLSKFVDKFIVHTEKAKETLIRACYVNLEKVQVIPLFIFPRDSKKVAHSNTRTVCYFGYIHIDKGIEYYIEAVNILSKRVSMSDVNFVIAGDVRPRKGIFKFFEKKDINYKQMLIQLVDKYALHDRLKFIGYVNEESVDKFLLSMDCFVLPYTSTEQSGALYQLLPFKKPIIASDVGGLGETLKDYGLLVRKKEPIEIADAIEKVMSSRSEWNKVSHSYDHLVDSQNIDVIKSKTLDLYSNQIGRK